MSNKIATCPNCGKELNGNFSVESRSFEKPGDDDFNVCAECGEISVFCDNGESLRKIIDADKKYIKENMDVFKNVMNISAKIKTDKALESLKVFNKAYKRNIN